MRNCLRIYCESSGQAVNFSKSSIIFSENTSPHVRYHVTNLFGVQQVHDFGKYLGLPSFLGRDKSAVFRYIEQRVRDGVNSWQKKILSRAGKEVLLKSVAQAMPIFSMSVFLLPQTFCTAIENIINRFWWENGGTTSRGIHWMSRPRLTLPKCNGGMGFERLHDFNIALLAKQGWCILTNTHSLVCRILKARYFPNSGFLLATLGHNPSYIWRSILAG